MRGESGSAKGKTCTEAGCEREQTARGLCLKHYRRWRNANREQIYNWQESLEERLWKSVEKTESCWIWRGATIPSGYGRLTTGGKRRGAVIYVHRLAYELLRGPIEEGKEIDHLCRDRRCVNPDHLQAVTRGENVRRGRSIAAANAAKTQCPRGHLYDKANTAYSKTGSRICRQCRRDKCRWSPETSGTVR